VLTAFAGFLFPEWNSFTIFLIMIVLIIVRPQGILG
jgi:branched-subunit amino acid ABC-type transport system permease component